MYKRSLKSITGLINIVVQKKGKRDNFILKVLVQRKYPKVKSDHGRKCLFKSCPYKAFYRSSYKAQDVESFNIDGSEFKDLAPQYAKVLLKSLIAPFLNTKCIIWYCSSPVSVLITRNTCKDTLQILEVHLILVLV